MHLVLLGGAPGVGKTTAAEEILELVARSRGGPLVQWADIDALWRHQPWRVDEQTVAMVRANIRAVLSNARDAGVDHMVVTWVFQDAGMHDLLRSLAPADVATTTVQLLTSPETWATRIAGRRPGTEDDPFYLERYRQAQSVAADHLVMTDGLPPAEVAERVAAAAGLLALP
ncbi:AAA family ATPase [Isoptericola croceus]|uniref:AAA family ATPase n=1 Tax=Isoptericola croceus TaxID=3031406 RepID=UPI0023F99A44|nr:AAA family ATPase [Isoptericola croceus]